MLPLLIRLENTETKSVEEYAYRRSPVRLGRNMLNDLALDLPFVSQWHAVVRFDDARTQYFDLGSTNGTVVQGRRISKDEPLDVTGSTVFEIGALRVTLARGQVTRQTVVDGVPFLRRDAAMLGQGPQMAEAKTSAAAAGFFGRIEKLRPQVAAMRPAHDAYRAAWKQFWQGAERMLAAAESDDERSALVSMLQEEFAGIGAEDDYREAARANRIEPTGPHGAAHAALDVIRRLGGVFVPDATPPASPFEVRRLVSRVAAVLDAFGASFVALRKGHDQLQEEMGLPGNRAAAEKTPVNTDPDPRGVLAYLLDWRVDSLQHVRELTTTYADIMNREVALLNGMMEGVRGLLRRIGPDEIEREARDLPVKLGPLRFARAPWGLRGAARWQQYVKRHREITEEDRAVTTAVFGPDFARAYAAALGENQASLGQRQLDSKT